VRPAVGGLLVEDERFLVNASLAGRRDAFHSLVKRFESLVFGVCLRMLGDRHEAEDVAQEVFLRMHKSLHRWDKARPLRHWLAAIAANRCRTSLAKRRNKPTAGEMVEDVPDRRPVEQDGGELKTALWEAVGELRPEYRQAFLLLHEQGLSYEEMSEAMDRPVGTLKTWLHRARAELLAKLRQKGLAEEVVHDRT
jgi:RNA polymerase sigma factor (sigma-70 family)